MRKVWTFLMRLLRRLRTFLAPVIRPLVVLAIYGLIVAAYAYSSMLADVGDTVMGPPVVQEALRAFIAVHIGRALWQRWNEFTAAQRWLWGLVAVGAVRKRPPGPLTATPPTRWFFRAQPGRGGVTGRLMAATRREVKLSKELAEARTLIAAQDAELTEARAEILRLKGAV